jgi:hypothetical protein
MVPGFSEMRRGEKGETAAFMPDKETILISENLFIGEDGDRSVLDNEIKVALSPLLATGAVQIVPLVKIKVDATNAKKANKSTLAVVISKDDFEDKEVWGTMDKEVSMKASVVLIDDKLAGNNYLYLEGVLALAQALMRGDRDKIELYYASMSLNHEWGKALSLLNDKGVNNIAFAIKAMIRFRPILDAKENDRRFNAYRLMMENSLIGA